jgi:prevent-host-death family protein
MGVTEDDVMQAPDSTTTRTMKAAEAQQKWSEMLDSVGHGATRIVVEERGVPIAAVVSPDDLQRLQQLDARTAERLKIVQQMRSSFADLSENEIERNVARVVAEVRAQDRDARPQTAESS